MYKIMTKMHTKREGIYRFLMVENENKQLVEFETDSRQAAEEMALSLLKKVGYADLRVVNDEPYYLEICDVLAL